MPFSNALENYRPIERLLRLHRNPIAAYGIAVAAVAVATLVRWVIGGQIDAVPFITYFPAIVIATLVGGFWPGMLATALSSLIAWYFFLPLPVSLGLAQREIALLLVFIFVAGINVSIVALLNVAVERVMAQEQNVHVLIESAPNGIVVVDQQGTIKLVNASTEKLFGYKRDELLGKSVEILVPKPQAAAHRVLRQSFVEKPTARAMGAGRDLSGRRKDGSEFPVEIGLNPISRNGRTGVLATVIDISARRRAEDSQQLTIRELQHRTQNLFAVVQSVVNNSLVKGRTIAEAKYVLSGRLQALARAYAMLANATWEGAPLDEILDRQFAGFSKCVNVSGCDIVVSPSAAQQFSMIIHELATNALKHGALSVPEGRVSIEGKMDRLNGTALFSFLWKESGGPPVALPTQKGFGSVILLDAAKQFAQSVVMDYAPQGLSYELLLPLSTLETSKKHEDMAPSDIRTASV